MTRIRYKDVNGLLVSPEYLAVNKLLKATIYPQLFEVEITEDNVVLFRSINLGNLQNCKKFAKRTLMEEGVNFEPEVRPRWSMDSDFYTLTQEDKLSETKNQVQIGIRHGLIKDDFGPNASKTYKDDLFEEDKK